jgi:hypothetical protein
MSNGNGYVPTKGKDVKVGDDLLHLGQKHRITLIVPYTHPGVTKGEAGWRIAYSGPVRQPVPLNAWGITLEPDSGHYEVMPGVQGSAA